MIKHKIDMPSEQMLFLLTRRRENVRYWFATYGKLVGVWTAKNGRDYAVGHNPAGHVIVYPTGRASSV